MEIIIIIFIFNSKSCSSQLILISTSFSKNDLKDTKEFNFFIKAIYPTLCIRGQKTYMSSKYKLNYKISLRTPSFFFFFFCTERTPS